MKIRAWPLFALLLWAPAAFPQDDVFVTGFIVAEEAPSEAVRVIDVRKKPSAEEIRHLKKGLGQEGFLLDGPGVSGGGNIVVADFIFMARQAGIGEDVLRAWQSDARLDVTEAEIRAEGERLLLVSDPSASMVLISRPAWQNAAEDEKAAAVLGLLESL